MKIQKTLLFMLISCSHLAHAVPTIYPTEFRKLIKNNTNSNILNDSEVSTRFYVLPPNSSFAKVTGLNSATANVGFCKELSEIQNYTRETVKSINQLKNKQIEMQLSIDDQTELLNKAQINLALYVTQQNMSWFHNIIFQLDQITNERAKLKDRLNVCSTDCNELQIKIEEKTEGIHNYINMLVEAEKKHEPSKIEKYNKLAGIVADLQKRKESMMQNFNVLKLDLLDIYKDYLSLYEAHSMREGGRVSINYDSQWTANIQRLRLDNPYSSFEQAPTQNVKIRAEAYDKKNLMPHGAVMSFNFGGIAANGVANLQSYPENFSGSASLNLLAVCPMLHPEWFDADLNKEWMNPENMKFGLTVSYEYPSEFKYDLKVNYNLYKMYEIVKTQGASGGFFSSKSWSSEEEKEFFKDSFSAEWKSQNTKSDLSPEEKFNIESDIKRQMLTRLASNLTMTNATNKLLSAPELPKQGGVVLSNALSKNCGYVLMCRAAGVALDLIYSVFTSTEVSQSLKKELNINMTEQYSSQELVMQNMLTTYW